MLVVVILEKNSNSYPDTSYTDWSYWSVTCIWIWRVINGVSDQYEVLSQVGKL